MKKNAHLMDSFEESRELFHRIAKKIRDDMKGRYSPREYELMVILKNLGRARLKEIAGYAGAKPLVCLRLGVLEKKKFVAREMDKADRRNIYYYIAPDGEKFIAQVLDGIKESMNGILSPLGGKDAADLAKSVEEVNRILKKVV
jgi:DNA-binding MarR family transcriptional regulator